MQQAVQSLCFVEALGCHLRDFAHMLHVDTKNCCYLNNEAAQKLGVVASKLENLRMLPCWQCPWSGQRLLLVCIALIMPASGVSGS